jgi:GDP-L-fucose synthase
MAEAMLHFMRHVDAKEAGPLVNVGLGDDISIRDLAHMLRDIIGYSGEIVFNPKMPDGMPRKMMDVSRATQLGWKAKVGIAEGLRLTYEWYRENAAA